MEARASAREYDQRDDLILAWQIGNFAGAAFAGKLQNLAHYLPTKGEQSPQQSSAMLFGFLMKMKRKGVPMTVERIERAA